jgi:hypothetical protein
MSYICVQMDFPVFHQFDADGTIRTNGLHWEGFRALRGKRSVPQATSPHRLTRWSLSAKAFPAAE